MRIEFKKLLALASKYDKDVTIEELFEVWITLTPSKQQFIIDSLDVIDHKKDYPISANAASYQNISQFAKLTKEFRKQNEFIAVLKDESTTVFVNKNGELVVGKAKN